MKRKEFLFILLITLFIPIRIHALTGDVVINCDKTSVKYNEEINCLLTGNNFSDEISSFHGEISLGSNLTLLSVTKDESWEGSGEKGIIDLYTDKNKSGKMDFVSFKVKVNEDSNVDSTISVSNVVVGDTKFNEIKLGGNTFNIKVVSNNTTNNNVDNNVTENPKTGTIIKSFIIFILLISLLLILMIYKKQINFWRKSDEK